MIRISTLTFAQVSEEEKVSRPKHAIFRNGFCLAGLVIVAGSFYAIFDPEVHPYPGHESARHSTARKGAWTL